MTTVSQLADAFQAIFGNADQIAQDTGFVQRVQKGKLTGKRFAVTRILNSLALTIVTRRILQRFADAGQHAPTRISRSWWQIQRSNWSLISQIRVAIRRSHKAVWKRANTFTRKSRWQ